MAIINKISLIYKTTMEDMVTTIKIKTSIHLTTSNLMILTIKMISEVFLLAIKELDIILLRKSF